MAMDPVTSSLGVEPEDNGSLLERPSVVQCWRCALEVPADAPKCPHCSAAIVPRIATSGQSSIEKPPSTNNTSDLFKVLRAFFLLMLISLFQALVLTGTPQNQETHDIVLVICQLIDSFVVLILAARIGFIQGIPNQTHRRLSSWILALPVLVLLLVINVIYHDWIRAYLKLDWMQLPTPEGLTRFTLLTHCLQPALVEEFFFRYLLFGVLRRHCDIHAAIHISSAMFAICHVHVLLSMPYLFLAGLVFGYARYYSQSLALPIGLHFLHNVIVTLWEAEA